MALVQSHTVRHERRGLPWFVRYRTTGEFARAAVFGALAVLGLALMLPGAAVGLIALAILLFAMVAVVMGMLLHRSYPHDGLGLCNYVTLARLVIVSALVVPMLAGSVPSWPFLILAAVGMSLDGIDGWLARRQGLESAFGARFDVEVDSALALVLALNAALNTDLGLAVALLGAPRYVFAGANLVLPWLRRPLPERFSRKVICVLQLATLILLQAPILPADFAALLIPLVAMALVWTFATDVAWLWRSRA